jgi:hypothetical protein
MESRQQMLGHASAAMTLDLHADLFDDDLDTVAAALNDGAVSSGVGEMGAGARNDDPADKDVSRAENQNRPADRGF